MSKEDILIGKKKTLGSPIFSNGQIILSANPNRYGVVISGLTLPDNIDISSLDLSIQFASIAITSKHLTIIDIEQWGEFIRSGMQINSTLGNNILVTEIFLIDEVMS